MSAQDKNKKTPDETVIGVRSSGAGPDALLGGQGSGEETRSARNPAVSQVQDTAAGAAESISATPKYLRTTGNWVVPIECCPWCTNAHTHAVDGPLLSPLTFNAPCGGGTYRVRMTRVQLGNEIGGWAS